MHITHICPRFKEIHGGGEPVIINLLHQLCELGHRNCFLTYSLPESMQAMIDSRVDIRAQPQKKSMISGNVLLAGFLDLVSAVFLVKDIPADTDVVCFHTESVVPALFYYKLFDRNTKPTLYFCFQPPRFAYDTSKETARSGGLVGLLLPVFKAIYRPFDRIAVRRADKVVTFSNGYKKWIESIYRISEVQVIPPGVEIPDRVADVAEDIKKRIEGEASKVLICVGKLVQWKRVDRLINIIGLLAEKDSGIRLLVVGDGPCLPALREQVEQGSLQDKIVFTGYQPAKAVFSFCKISDLLVLLEKNASFGLALIEANAMGVPVMALEGGGPSDIVENGRNGILLPENNSDKEIASIIADFFSKPEIIASMREHAITVSREYTWRRFAEKFVSIARSLV